MDRRKLAHESNLRKGRWSSSQQIYHITTCTRSRAPIFADFHLARGLVKVLRSESEIGSCTTLAYVIMPDHLHWLMQLLEGDLPTVVGRVKSLSAREAGWPIWQAGFHDHALRLEEDLRSVARYIIANPLRAGLTDSVGDYPHWDAVWF